MNLTFLKLQNPSETEVLIPILESYPELRAELNTIGTRYQQELLETDNRSFFIVNDDAGACIAYGQLIFRNADNDPEPANADDIAHVHDLRVRSELQGKGFGKAFMDFLEKTALAAGIRTLTLGVDNWNHRAIALYNKLGYEKFKEADGRTDDEKVFYLKKDL